MAAKKKTTIDILDAALAVQGGPCLLYTSDAADDCSIV